MASADAAVAPKVGPWVHASGEFDLSAVRVMAIVNLTIDSFSDGGRFVDASGPRWGPFERACREMQTDGADILDLGAESTRPGARAVPPAEEAARLLPALERLRRSGVPLSVDTRHASTARLAMNAGASIINDISGLADPQMATVAAESGAGLVIGHLRGDPKTMQRGIAFVDVLDEVAAELLGAVDKAVAAGVQLSRIVVDPGIGFGKTALHSAALIAASGQLRAATGCPVLIGASRKSFMTAFGAGAQPETRIAGSLAAAVVAAERGASILRVHDVAATVEALSVADGIRKAHAAERGRPMHAEEYAT